MQAMISNRCNTILKFTVLGSALFSFVVTQDWPSRLTVAQDGSGNFTTIQAAVNAVRDLSQVQVEIYVKPGNYQEKLIIPSWKTKISLIGENRSTTIVSNADYTGKPRPFPDPTGQTVFNTFTSYTVLVQGDDFRASNLTFENVAGQVGQAVALHVEGDRAVFRDCAILGNQDTIYAASQNSRQYYSNCYIEGTTDFIFGEATAIFDNCLIRTLRNSYITAASTRPETKFGFVLRNCTIISATDVTSVYLGRPWRPHAKTVFLNTTMGSFINPSGWHNWGSEANEATAFYAEYNTQGVNVTLRVPWSHQLTEKEAFLYNVENIFAIDDSWVPEHC
ncbi:pectinesterase 31-like [Bradysia coprophila]|uniref:pectinesterase 31-like n=1 Tax=Bradysia coprophila TaxID=38358 RepID=UPI00187D7593|nr:pectinesterase 31-like [Bradysia coprophila]